MKIELIDRTNGDLLAVNSARVSMAKHHAVFNPMTDSGLLAYLARENHFTPYTHARMSARVPLHSFDLHGLTETERAGLVWEVQGDVIKLRHSVFGWVRLLKTDRLKGLAARGVAALLTGKFPRQVSALFEGEAPSLAGPFAHGYAVDDSEETDPRFIDVTFRLTACIPVVRQIQKTMVGLALNEVSRRYVDEPPVFDTPKVWRSRPVQNVKQGSGGALTGWRQLAARGLFATAREVSRMVYWAQVQLGVAPEQARWSLLQAMETQGYFTYSLTTLRRLYELRMDGHAQAEAREVVREMSLAVECSDDVAVMRAWVSVLEGVSHDL